MNKKGGTILNLISGAILFLLGTFYGRTIIEFIVDKLCTYFNLLC